MPLDVHALVHLRLSVVACLALSGCYLSHGRGEPADGGPRDATMGDAGTDAATHDAATQDAGTDAGICTGVRLASTVLLDDGASSVTPRLVALGGGDIGVVHVSSDGSPTRVRFDRLGPALERRGSATVATDSFTWAEPVSHEGALFVAYGLAGDDDSVLLPITADGERRGPPVIVPLPHPSILQPWRGGLFWLAFDMRGDNALVVAHLDRAGALVHPAVTIPLGRYGSGHGAVSRPDGHSHVVTYPAEGPPGVRRAYVDAVDPTGARGPERQLAEEGDALVRPIRQDGRLVLVQHGDALVLELADFETLEPIERFIHPARETRPFLVGALGGRALVGHVSGGEIRMDDFGFDLAREHDRVAVRPPRGAVNGPSGSVLEVPGSFYVAVNTIDGGTSSHPMIARFTCTLE